MAKLKPETRPTRQSSRIKALETAKQRQKATEATQQQTATSKPKPKATTAKKPATTKGKSAAGVKKSTKTTITKTKGKQPTAAKPKKPSTTKSKSTPKPTAAKKKSTTTKPKPAAPTSPKKKITAGPEWLERSYNGVKKTKGLYTRMTFAEQVAAKEARKRKKKPAQAAVPEQIDPEFEEFAKLHKLPKSRRGKPTKAQMREFELWKKGKGKAIVSKDTSKWASTNPSAIPRTFDESREEEAQFAFEKGYTMPLKPKQALEFAAWRDAKAGWRRREEARREREEFREHLAM